MCYSGCLTQIEFCFSTIHFGNAIPKWVAKTQKKIKHNNSSRSVMDFLTTPQCEKSAWDVQCVASENKINWTRTARRTHTNILCKYMHSTGPIKASACGGWDGRPPTATYNSSSRFDWLGFNGLFSTNRPLSKQKAIPTSLIHLSDLYIECSVRRTLQCHNLDECVLNATNSMWHINWWSVKWSHCAPVKCSLHSSYI